MNRRTFAAVEHTRLQKTLVGGFTHLSAEGVELTDKVSLRCAAD